MFYIYDLYLNDYYYRATDLCSGSEGDVCFHVWNVLV
jgi:hypothetical protein